MRLPRVVAGHLAVLVAALLVGACTTQQTPRATPDAATREPVATEAEETEDAEPTEAEETGEPSETGRAEGEYVRLQHDEVEMVVSVPASWDDTDTNDLWSWEDENVGYTIEASPDLESLFALEYEVPGVWFAASSELAGELTPDDILDGQGLSECELEGREDYSDPAYTGVVDTYVDCAGSDATFRFIAAEANDASHVVSVQVSTLTEEDEDAYQRIVDTFLAQNVPPAD